MHIQRSLGLCFAILLGVGLAGAAFADEVFPVSVSFSTSSQDGPTIAHDKVSDAVLINLARGRSPGAPVPSNEILAFKVDCASGDGSLIVFDTIGLTSLATVATTDRTEIVVSGTKGEFGILLDFANSGSPQNKIRGGTLMTTGKLSVGQGNCPVALKASGSGIIDVTFTDLSTQDVTAILTKGKFSTGSTSIATLP